jgi:hypothetical protein
VEVAAGEHVLQFEVTDAASGAVLPEVTYLIHAGYKQKPEPVVATGRERFHAKCAKPSALFA